MCDGGGRDGDAGDDVPPREGRDPALSETLRAFGHDIRATMSDVVGGLRLIETERLDTETRLQVERVRAAGDALAGMIEAALMAASGEDFVRSPEARVDLWPLVDNWRSRWEGRASDLGVAFELSASDALPSGILAPRLALDRIVGNLVANALQHAAASAIRLTLSSAPGKGLLIEVADDGTGLPAAAIEGEVPGSEDGHGLGLRIVREMCGQIDATLRLGNGRPLGGGVARLQIPEDRLDRCETTKAPPLPDLSGLRILLAEDNLTNQLIIMQMLERMGVRPLIVSDGAEALKALDRHVFDIALIDIEMPHVSGLDVIRAVRSRGGDGAGLPLVALTAYVLRDNREAIYAAGADGIMPKPVASAEEFGRAILRYAGRPDAGARDAEPGEAIDPGRLERLLSGAGPEGAVELLDRLRTDLAAVRDALAAAVQARCASRIRAQTHVLVGLAGVGGADRLARRAEALNIAAKRGRLAEIGALHASCRSDLDELLTLAGRAAATVSRPCARQRRAPE